MAFTSSVYVSISFDQFWQALTTSFDSNSRQNEFYDSLLQEYEFYSMADISFVVVWLLL